MSMSVKIKFIRIIMLKDISVILARVHDTARSLESTTKLNDYNYMNEALIADY